jgi:hypothetical protein
MSGLALALPRDFIEFVQALEQHEVEYVIIGGLAMAFHGHVRATKDLDVFVQANRTNAPRLLAALKDFGAPLGKLTAADFSKREAILQIGVAPVRIDVTTTVDGIRFGEAKRGSIVVDFGGVRARVIGKAALIKNKTASGRPQDLADVEALRRLRSRSARL